MAVRRPAAPPAVGANFGEMGFYGGALGLSEGLWAMAFTTQLFQPTKRDGSATGSPFLAVMAECHPINEDGTPRDGEVDEHPFSMGTKAKDGWQPSADGKGIVQIPGTSVTLSDMANWGLFLKSLYDSGLPQGVFTNSLASLDGIWVRTQNIPESDERRGLRSQSATGETGEAQQPARNRKTTVCVEILEAGKPWEGTGGIPEEAAAPAPKAGAKAAPKAAVARPATRPAAPPPEESEAEDLETLALSATTDALSANPDGCAYLKLRSIVFSQLRASHDDDTAAAIMATYYDAGDASLNKLLNQLGYQVKNKQISVKG